MTIKEIETLSGMTRANIRFYEKEGLFSTERDKNGYRNYSQDDLDILRKIKLLRQLHISLDEIKELQAGKRELIDTLNEQITILEQKKKDVSYAQSVCKVMLVDNVIYSSMDAQKYLEEISIATSDMKTDYFDIDSDQLPQVFYPWRRFFARQLDIMIYSTAWSVILALLLRVNIINRGTGEKYLDTFVALVFMLFIEPLLLCMFGTTVGKLILGLQIANSDGGRLSYEEALQRTWGVIGLGMGYGIPIYNIVRYYKSYKRCSDYETQPWDEEISYTIKDTKRFRAVVYVAVNILLFCVIAFTLMLAELPENRGDINTSEFAENYNILVKYFDIDSSKHLDNHGKWVDNELDNNRVIPFVPCYFSLPDFKIIETDGIVTEITFEVEVKGGDSWISEYNSQMIIAVLSYVSAQRDMNPINLKRDRIIDIINNSNFTDFNFTQSGVTVSCDVEYSGYFYMNDESVILVPMENVEPYFHMIFKMDKTGL